MQAAAPLPQPPEAQPPAPQKSEGGRYTCLVVAGPTATGKTALAVKLAGHFAGEVISADSRQVYRGLDIGSGKDLREFALPRADGSVKKIPYHLIDIADVQSEYSVFNYQRDFYRAFAELAARKVLPVVCGGTGMYLDAVIRAYDMLDVPTNVALRESFNGKTNAELAALLLALKPELHNTTDLTERHRLIRAIEIAEYERSEEARAAKAQMPPRPDIRPYILGLTFPREVLRARISARLRSRLEEGMLDEVRALHEAGASWERLERLGLEYRFVSEYLQGKIATFDGLYNSLNTAIGQFAKRQETWFRGMERKGVAINWIATDAHTTAEEVYERALQMLAGAGFAP